jgi:hypothetical protein
MISSCICCGGTHLDGEFSEWMPFIAARLELSDVVYSLTCRDCGAVFCSHRFTDAEMQKLYNDYHGKEYTDLREKYEPGYWQRNESLKQTHFYLPQVEGFIKPYLKPGRVLDYGGGNGVNTPFKDRECDIYDIDGKQIKLRGPYALMVLSNVLEHVPYPADLLIDLCGNMDILINSDTVLYIEVPYCPPGFVSRRGWHEHINFFPQSAMLAMLERCGLTVLDSIYQEPVYQLVVKLC